jgi:hypothetical protein
MPLSFEPARRSPVQAKIRSSLVALDVGDFNQDGQLDVVILNSPFSQPISKLEVQFGDGKGQLLDGKVTPLNLKLVQPEITKVSDFNQDGSLDLLISGSVFEQDLSGNVVSTYKSSVKTVLFLGDKAGGFTLSPQLQRNRSSSEINIDVLAIADFNNDGNLDLIGRGDQSEGSLWLGDASGRFQNAGSLSTLLGAPIANVEFAIAGDLNQDGLVDLIVNQPIGMFDKTVNQSVFLNAGVVNGVQKFVQRSTILTIRNEALYGAELGDFNQDGQPDILTYDRVFWGDGSGLFSQPQRYGFAGSLFSTIDLNQDGILDIAAQRQFLRPGGRSADFGVAVLLGDGKGGFGIPTQYPIAEWSRGATPFQGAAAGDFNRDGKPDLVMTVSADRQVAVLLNQGQGQSAIVIRNNTLNASAVAGRLRLNLGKKQFTIGQEKSPVLGISRVTGTPSSDRIVGNNQQNVLYGSDGNDVLSGLGGDDLLIGGTGRDRLTGGAGDDRFMMGKYQPELYYQSFSIAPDDDPKTPYRTHLTSLRL